VPRPVDASKHQAILQAATELLFSEGPQACSMDAVARRAGVSKVTGYARFANRQVLLDAVVQQCVRDLSTELDVTPASRVGVREALIGFGERVVAFIQSEDYWRFVRAIAGLQGLSSEEAALIYQKGPQFALMRLAAWMQAADAAGLAHFPAPERSAEHLLGMWVGLDIVRALYGLPPQRDTEGTRRHVAEVVDLFMQIHESRPIMKST
jgi:TetR/AcrR family transcriptional repressor of mexJK operon